MKRSLENKIKLFIIKSKMIGDLNKLKLKRRNLEVRDYLGEEYNPVDPWDEEVWNENISEKI